MICYIKFMVELISKDARKFDGVDLGLIYGVLLLFMLNGLVTMSELYELALSVNYEGFTSGYIEFYN